MASSPVKVPVAGEKVNPDLVAEGIFDRGHRHLRQPTAASGGVEIAGHLGCTSLVGACQITDREARTEGGELVDRVKELIKEGNVRRLIIKKQDGILLMEIPLTAGVAVGGVFTILAPVLAALGAMAALLAKVKVEIVRVEKSE